MADVDEPNVGPPTDPDRPADGPPDERRPTRRHMPDARSSSGSAWPLSRRSWPSCSAASPLASWVGGELFLAVDGRDRLPDDRVGRWPDAVPRLTNS